MDIHLRSASENDFPAIVSLMNLAFRGKDGWSIEGDYITGERTNISLLTEEVAKGALYLVAHDDASSTLQGCVSLHAASPEKWYLGALTVRPDLQKGGFGRELLAAAERYAGARTIEMTVVHVRESLIAWYERRGYRRTTETRPFPYSDTRYGTPTQPNLFFIVLEKHLTP